MSAPKSVVKVLKDNDGCRVEYTSDVDAAQYYIHELSRAAMRDVGKFLARTFKEKFYSHFKKRTGNAGRATKYKVFASEKTIYPRVQIGLKTGQVTGFYAYFQEFGTKDGRVPKLGLLKESATENVAEIVKIESQYLSALGEEAERLASLVTEDDMEGSADE